MEISNSTSQNIFPSSAIDSTDLGLLPEDNNFSEENNSAFVDPLSTEVESLEVITLASDTADVFNQSQLSSAVKNSLKSTKNKNKNIDSLTGVSVDSSLSGTQLVDGLFTVDELLSRVGFPTRTPDLISVSNFRPGTPTDDGNPRTFVDYTFDEAAELSGGDATNFNLVPVDGGPVLDAKELISGDNTNVYTIAYLGTIEQADIARGFVDSGTVRGPGEKPTNPLESADVSNGGNTTDPDLVSVVPNITTNELIYTFDQEVNIDDDAGFGFYKRNGKEFDGSLARQLTPTTVAVEFVDVDVSSAVGATVDNGAVADLQDDSNQPDEVLVGTLI